MRRSTKRQAIVPERKTSVSCRQYVLVAALGRRTGVGPHAIEKGLSNRQWRTALLPLSRVIPAQDVSDESRTDR